MPATGSFPKLGGCACRRVRYRLETEPLFVHCCHCRWCQRETGSGFVINVLLEAERVTALEGAEPELVDTPSRSGNGQLIARCPACRVAVWSHYYQAGRAICFVRAGTLDEPHHIAPDVHIYTASKLPWVLLPEGVPTFPEFYDVTKTWPPESLLRAKAARERLAASAG